MSDSAYTHEIVRDCMVQYGRYVLSDRAIPSVFDGLKIGGRRTLWALWKLGATSKKLPIKSAQVVGRLIGEFHPHGDAAAYDALVHMVHLQCPLVHGEGNFGDPDAIPEDSPAAARYTECKLSAFADHLFDDIDVLPMVPNFSETTEEPTLLPARLPLVLLNGCQGIAVGLSTSIPPHNLEEILDATLLLLRDPAATIEDLLGCVKGPDYGQGVLLSKRADLLALYQQGQGRLQFTSQYCIEETERPGIKKLVVTGLAPELKKARLKDTVADLHKKRLLESPLQDETTAKRGLRLTVEYRDAGVLQTRVLPLLESAVSYRWFVLDQQGNPCRSGLAQILQQFLEFRRDIEAAVLKRRRRQLRKDLGTAEAKLAAVRHLDEVVAILQKITDEEAAKTRLCKLLNVEAWQAEVILGSTLRSLMRLHESALMTTVTTVTSRLTEVAQGLGDIDAVVASRLEEMRAFRQPRGTVLRAGRQRDAGTVSKQWVGVGFDGAVDVSLDLPIKSKAQWRYCGFFATDQPFVVVRADNTAVQVQAMYLDRYAAGTTIGASGASHCLVVSPEGHYCCFPTQQRRTTFPVFRGTVMPLLALPLDVRDTVVLVLTTGAVHRVEFADLKVTRPNVQPHRLFRTGTVASAIRVQPGETAYLSTGQELGSAERVKPGSN
jgi:DNA gyrase subunit A